MGFGIINFLFAAPAIYYIDLIGRRSLLPLTFPLTAIFQLGVALSFLAPHKKVPVVIFSYLFAMAYSVGEGPVPFVSL